MLFSFKFSPKNENKKIKRICVNLWSKKFKLKKITIQFKHLCISIFIVFYFSVFMQITDREREVTGERELEREIFCRELRHSCINAYYLIYWVFFFFLFLKLLFLYDIIRLSLSFSTFWLELYNKHSFFFFTNLTTQPTLLLYIQHNAYITHTHTHTD